MMSATPTLEVSGVSMTFGGIKALDDVSLRANEGEVLGIIGPNGAGKTTLFSVIAGFLRPAQGTVTLDGRCVNSLGPHQRCRLGMIRTWQLPRPFSSMTVRENILVAAVAESGSVRQRREVTDEVLADLGLQAWAARSASDLPPGQRKRLELARALVRRPQLLLLDEVMAGQTAAEADVLFSVLRSRVRNDGMSIVMIEHVVRAVRSMCDRIVVLANGRVLAEGEPDPVMRLPEVVTAYLGTAHLDPRQQVRSHA